MLEVLAVHRRRWQWLAMLEDTSTSGRRTLKRVYSFQWAGEKHLPFSDALAMLEHTSRTAKNKTAITAAFVVMDLQDGKPA